MQIIINIEKKHLYSMIFLVVILVGGIFTFAYTSEGTNGNPAYMGHSFDELGGGTARLNKDDGIKITYAANENGFGDDLLLIDSSNSLRTGLSSKGTSYFEGQMRTNDLDIYVQNIATKGGLNIRGDADQNYELFYVADSDPNDEGVAFRVAGDSFFEDRVLISEDLITQGNIYTTIPCNSNFGCQVCIKDGKLTTC